MFRACRNAIEFNSLPSMNAIVPGGYANMKLRVQLAVPVPEVRELYLLVICILCCGGRCFTFFGVVSYI